MKLIQNEKGEFVKVPLTDIELAAMQPSPYQLALEAWGNTDYPIRIVAPISMLDPVNPDNDMFHKFYNWLLAQGLPMVNVGDSVQIYMNVILENHRAFVDSITEITIEHRPKAEDYD